MRQFDLLVLSEVPGVVLRLCAQGEGTFLHIARYEALLAPRIGAQPFLANRSFTTWGSGNHLRQYKAWLALVRYACEELRICSIPRKGKMRMRVAVAMFAAQPPRTSRNPDVNLGRPSALARATPS